MKLFNYFRWDIVSFLFLIITAVLAVYYASGGTYSVNAGYWLFACVLFIFRGIVWQGQYVEWIRELEELIKKLTNKPNI